MAINTEPVGTLGPNSYRSKTEGLKGPRIQNKVDGLVTPKESLGKKFAKAFKPKDIDSIKTYVVMDVLVPSIMNAVMDSVNGFLEMWFDVPSRGRRRTGNGVFQGTNEQVPYTAYYAKAGGGVSYGNAPVRHTGIEKRTKPDYRTIIMNSEAGAKEVLELMRAAIDQYTCVSVSDLYAAIGAEGDYTDANWGWTDLTRARVVRTAQGYLLDLPNAVPLTQ